MRAISVCSLLLVVLLAFVATATGAQEWRGMGRLSGVVTGADGGPVVGARVTLRRVDAPELGPESVLTNRKGRWAILGLAEGRWQIEIEADGFLTSRGWVQVLEGTPTAPVEVSLRTLAEISPLASEGSPATLAQWIEKGNSLLAQGQHAAAREEYEKALRELPLRSRPEVLRAVARTHYLEGDSEAAIEALREAVVIAPGDTTSRQLLWILMEQTGRREEATRFFAEVDHGGTGRQSTESRPPSAPIAVAAAPEGPEGELGVPSVAPAAGRPGRYRTSFARRSPFSEIAGLLRRLGSRPEDIRATDPAAGAYDLAQESFEVRVPESNRSDEPYGLLVWISPGDSGGFSRLEIEELLEAHRLIWIGANRSGNERPRWTRHGLALDAVHNMKELYRLDERRIYVAGYSGGGRVASALALLYPEVFSGGLFLFGCDYFRRIPIPDRPGTHWPARFPRPESAQLKAAKRQSRLVLVTGELDFNRAQVQQTFELMRGDGFAHVSYLEIPGASHYDGLDETSLERAVVALDALPRDPG